MNEFHKGNGQRIKCNLCEYRARNSSRLSNHVKYVHNTSKVKCELCQKLISEANLKIHINNIHFATESKCHLCNKTFKSSSTLKKHIRCDPERVNDVNKEAATIARRLELADRIDAMSESPALISIKDHKDGFPQRVEHCLINKSKSNIGAISKRIRTELIAS